jgi:putative ABC transport system permease protein
MQADPLGNGAGCERLGLIGGSMLGVALKMLMGDRVKYFGLIFGIAFATLLMTQQVSIFVGLLTWGANPVLDVREAEVWVMDQRVRQPDEGLAISDSELYRVRSVEGVEWAVPYFRATATIKTVDGRVNAITLIGIDNASLVGLPPDNRDAAAAAIRGRNAMVLDRTLVGRIWDDGRNPIGEVVEINDNRVTIAELSDALPTFAGLPVGYMKFTDAITITPPERNKLSFVLARPKAGVTPEELARRIEAQTGLKALTRAQFAGRGVDFIVTNTGIPASFGIAIALGVIVAIVITALTLAMFIAENLKSFGALKAIGVTNSQILSMVLAQSWLVGFIGFGLGIGGTAAFLAGAANDPSLDGFLMHWQVIAAAAALIALIVTASALVSVRRVLKMDPAIVFRG